MQENDDGLSSHDGMESREALVLDQTSFHVFQNDDTLDLSKWRRFCVPVDGNKISDEHAQWVLQLQEASWDFSHSEYNAVRCLFDGPVPEGITEIMPQKKAEKKGFTMPERGRDY